MNGIMKIAQALEDSNILLKGITKTIKNETKEQKGGFLGMLLGTLGASSLGNMLTRKGMLRAGYGNKEVKGVVRAAYGSENFLTPLHPLTSFEIHKYYQNEPRFNGVYSRVLSKRIKDGAYVINFDEYADVGTYWIALYVKNIEIIFFKSFGVDHVPNEI